MKKCIISSKHIYFVFNIKTKTQFLTYKPEKVRNYFLPKPHSQTHTGGSDLLFAIEQAIATEIQYMIYNTLNSNYLYLVDTLK